MSISASTRPDINYLSLYAKDGQSPRKDFTDVDGSAYATVLKLTDGYHDQTVTGLKVNNGHETSCDIDLAKNVALFGDFGLGNQLGDNILRIKGGSENITLAGTLHSRGQRNDIDIEIGNWMDQDYGMSKNIDLTGILLHGDGRGKVRVAIGWAVPFSVKLGENCEYLLLESLKIKAYWLLKWSVRTVLRIPKGTKGPSWL